MKQKILLRDVSSKILSEWEKSREKWQQLYFGERDTESNVWNVPKPHPLVSLIEVE